MLTRQEGNSRSRLHWLQVRAITREIENLKSLCHCSSFLAAVSRRLKYPSLNFSHHSVVPYPNSRIDDYCLANGATTGTLLQGALQSRLTAQVLRAGC